MLLLAVGALVEVADSAGVAAGLTAGLFLLVAVFALVWGGAHLWAAILLRQRKPFGRVLMLGLAVVNLLMLPIGTALGVYALWILLTNEGRRRRRRPRRLHDRADDARLSGEGADARSGCRGRARAAGRHGSGRPALRK